jgi:glucose dehydrogenase
VDLLPTLLDIVGVAQPAGFDGRSFAGLLRGEKQDGWDMVFKAHNENSGGQATPMTYTGADGRQYVLVVAGGHGSLGTKAGDYVRAYVLQPGG